MRRTSRIIGSLLIVAGALTLAWVVLVWRWEDPFTALYTHFQQARLSSTYERRPIARDQHVVGREPHLLLQAALRVRIELALRDSALGQRAQRAAIAVTASKM